MENVKENGTKIRIVTVFNIISPLSNQGAFLCLSFQGKYLCSENL